MTKYYLASFGSNPGITCAMYNGDFSKTLEQAQADKRQYILDGINFKPGDRVLDIGCGWGNMLATIRKAGGKGLGLTLSPEQYATCKRSGFEVMLQDYKKADPSSLGKFDQVVSIGAFEHFCSMDEFAAGKQEEIYRNFFKFCHELLPHKGRMFLQTMMWGDKGIPSVEKIRGDSPKYSDYWYMGLLETFYPGSWLPNGLEQIQACAAPYFKLVSENNGRLDYIETIEQWQRRLRKLTIKKIGYILRLLPKFITDTEFRERVISVWNKANMVCFERNIMSHQRMVFERVN
jgi:cyclopropane-fatty-acyl-phospholipid synthase